MTAEKEHLRTVTDLVGIRGGGTQVLEREDGFHDQQLGSLTHCEQLAEEQSSCLMMW